MMRVPMRTAAFLLCVVFAATGVSAQSTRTEAIAEQQAEKAKQLGVEGPSKAEQIIRQVLLSPLLSGGDGVYPWFGSVFSGTGMAIGAGYLKRFEDNGSANVQAGISINNSKTVRGAVASPEVWRDMLQFHASAQWLDARGVSYYGRGQDSDRANRERYDYKPVDLTTYATFKPGRFFTLSGGYSLLDFTTVRDVPLFDSDEMPGVDRDLIYGIASASVAFDWRTSPGYSTRGGYYRATFENSRELEGRPFSFRAQEYEVVQLLPLVREQFVLAGRALMTLTSTGEGHQVPIVLAPFLGSGTTLRGYSNRRFTDRNRVLLSGEYRWRPSRYLDMALFLDAGQVAATRNELDVSEFDTSWGIGARFHGPNFTALRIEAARGREGLRLVFTGSQAF